MACLLNDGVVSSASGYAARRPAKHHSERKREGIPALGVAFGSPAAPVLVGGERFAVWKEELSWRYGRTCLAMAARASSTDAG